MPPVIEKFAPSHVEAAASLLAARQKRLRSQLPSLPARFESTTETRVVIDMLAGRGDGVAAIDRGRLTGYLLGVPEEAMHGRAVRVPYGGQATADPVDSSLIEDMYAAASPAWIERGFFTQVADVLQEDAAWLEASVALGFASELVLGVRDIGSPEIQPTYQSIERAGPGSIDDVEELIRGLGRYHSQPPLYRPYVPPLDGTTRRETRLRQLEDPSCSFWLAKDQADRPVGLMIFTPPHADEAMISPDDSIYLWIAYIRPEGRSYGVGNALLNRGLTWAREQGYARCTVAWFSANLTGARYWTGRGFQPLGRRLLRRMDQRIAWAQAEG